MLARGIASDPDLLLVDEPTAQLDRDTAESVVDAIAAIRSEGRLVVVATHDPAVLAACSATIDLQNGASPAANEAIDK